MNTELNCVNEEYIEKFIKQYIDIQNTTSWDFEKMTIDELKTFDVESISNEELNIVYKVIMSLFAKSTKLILEQEIRRDAFLNVVKELEKKNSRLNKSISEKESIVNDTKQIESKKNLFDDEIFISQTNLETKTDKKKIDKKNDDKKVTKKSKTSLINESEVKKIDDFTEEITEEKPIIVSKPKTKKKTETADKEEIKTSENLKAKKKIIAADVIIEEKKPLKAKLKKNVDE